MAEVCTDSGEEDLKTLEISHVAVKTRFQEKVMTQSFRVFAQAPTPDRTPEDDASVLLAQKSAPKIRRPSMYKVFLLNDDYTPMDFVIQILETHFNKSHAEATAIMFQVHQKGSGLCGIYPFEVAETKVALVLEAARREEHPLQCALEKA